MGASTLEAQPRIATHMATTARLLNDYGSVRDCVYQPGRNITTEASVGNWVLAVVHSDIRGTKKAVDDTIYAAGASNLQSAHRDFPRFGIAYDLNILDRPLTESGLQALVTRAGELTGDPLAIRSVRQFQVREPR
jgi:D-3-phosphoglycerate dehydrogenase